MLIRAGDPSRRAYVAARKRIHGRNGRYVRPLGIPDTESPKPSSRDETQNDLSKDCMEPKSHTHQMNFTLTKPAEDYLKELLPRWTEETSRRQRVPIFSYCGGGTSEQEGRVVWEYNGPICLVASHKPETVERQPGKYYDVLGFRLWMSDADTFLLDGQVLTYKQLGHPEPELHLVIDHVPENFFELRLAGSCEYKSQQPANREVE